MRYRSKPMTILVAENDPADRRQCLEALQEANIAHQIRVVEDGGELLHYLCRTGKYASPAVPPRPGIILLDISLPYEGRFDLLQEIKLNPTLRQIPVIIMADSKVETQIFKAYEMGASGYIIRPVQLEALVEIMQVIKEYWFELVQTPSI